MICQMTTRAYHVTNQTSCVACGTVFCMTCSWGCPACKLGWGLDRRVERRIERSGVTVDIRRDDE